MKSLDMLDEIEQLESYDHRSGMDYIKRFDIELEKEVYYAGEKLKGHVLVENIENIKIKGIRVNLRGKAHVEWKIMRSGERRTVKEDHHFLEDKAVVWGKGKDEEGSIPILPRGKHHFPMEFQLPESALPCSFESKIGTVRYYLRCVIDIPYASPPQGIKYFTIIGPHIDCMDERFLSAMSAEDHRNACCLCCGKGPVSLSATLARSAYCCGENMKLKCEIQNGSDENVWVICRLIQYVEYFINKGVLGLSKEIHHRVWEYKGPTVEPHHTQKCDDLYKHLQVPVMPTTVVDVCKVLQIYYVLRVSLGQEKSGENLEIDFPLTIATVPFRISNTPSPELEYQPAAPNVEGGIYISPEFQLGQVYDGTETGDDVILYRPIYVCVPHEKMTVTNSNNAGQIVAEQVTSSSTKMTSDKELTLELEKELTIGKDFEVPEEKEITEERTTTV
ncbi:arrestin domain-containing protein 3-like isoform X2 [Lineus longissimus]|uniref:arrestin domain-containing protein 3-like isoform X2 n=1 Tax=Lineus longissimus TaxID=88925 RepID=UPI002B4EFB35